MTSLETFESGNVCFMPKPARRMLPSDMGFRGHHRVKTLQRLYHFLKQNMMSGCKKNTILRAPVTFAKPLMTTEVERKIILFPWNHLAYATGHGYKTLESLYHILKQMLSGSEKIPCPGSLS
ncbi:hypothetical protein AVEN_157369-1 [Araneus ventricosus]|uniref:Uncharacterized protein n=1 Tax=Araneus ventricosus TaxID=182803 RepID=A0A4Y2Q0S7_ARAVE|nr:hypothetical protein AVEN_150139-1 [Araneus ventricosus]GBN57120.1 hypothetical protein AVEN_157369-1 [Araneus ventricosus]